MSQKKTHLQCKSTGYPTMKLGCLCCWILQTQASGLALGIVAKSLMNSDGSRWFQYVSTYSAECVEYLTIFH
jgi:hypothetical protein